MHSDPENPVSVCIDFVRTWKIMFRRRRPTSSLVQPETVGLSTAFLDALKECIVTIEQIFENADLLNFTSPDYFLVKIYLQV